MLNLIGPQEMQIAGEKLVLGVMGGDFWERLVLEFMDELSRQPSQMSVGIIQPTEGLQRPKTEESLNSLSAGLNKLAQHIYLLFWVLLVFSPVYPHWNWYNLFSDPQAFQLYHRLSWVSCLKNTDHGTSQAPQPCEAILFNKCLSRFILLALFLW